MKEEFDLASYPRSSSYNDPTNNKLMWKFKDEASGQSMTKLVGLKPKVNSYQTLNETSWRYWLHLKQAGKAHIRGGTAGSTRKDPCAQSSHRFQVASDLWNRGLDQSRVTALNTNSLNSTSHCTLYPSLWTDLTLCHAPTLHRTMNPFSPTLSPTQHPPDSGICAFVCIHQYLIITLLAHHRRSI